MKCKPIIHILLTLIAILISMACEDELANCYTTVCNGPNNTNCYEEPVLDSGCFPLDNSLLEKSVRTENNDQHR